MSDERPPLQDRHFEQLCQFVLEYGIPFPEMYHKQIAQRLLELIPPVPRPRGRPESHTAEAGWDVEWLIENGVAQAEARKLIAEHHRLSLPTVQRAHQRHLQVKKQEDITSEIQHHGLSLQAVQRIYQRHLQVMKRKVKKRKISRRR